MIRPLRLLITGGGTGGHLFPAIATAEGVCRKVPGSEVLFVGTKRRMDKVSLARYGYATRSIHSRGLKGKNFVSLVGGLVMLPLSIAEAIWHIVSFKPDLVLGVGGYVTGPVVMAAKLLGKPTIIHEQNSVPGLANRKLGYLATKICLSLPGSEKWFDKKRCVLTGNPVRESILALARETATGQAENKTILILGGSLGAHRINELMPAVLGGGDFADIEIIHQTGVKDCEMVRSSYEKYGLSATVAPFFEDMAGVYRKADLLVSRAGATTLSELAVLGKPAILIPYPYAADSHQEKNAAYYAHGGGAIVLLEKELTVAGLTEVVGGILSDPEKLENMKNGMKSCAFPEATAKMVDECLSCAGRLMVK